MFHGIPNVLGIKIVPAGACDKCQAIERHVEIWKHSSIKDVAGGLRRLADQLDNLSQEIDPGVG